MTGKYVPGNEFGLHTDTGLYFDLLVMEKSNYTLLIYLNDDFEGGMTTFNHYDLDVKPVTGLTLIWPAEWTHAHQGQVITTGSKYIITGWLNMPLIAL